MGNQGIPPDIKAFILERIDSVVQAEVLLLLYRNAPQSYDAAEIAKELRIDRSAARDQLLELTSRGLLAPAEGQSEAYQYQPQTLDFDRAVAGLAREYEDRRVSVISLIYSKPIDQIRSFADAFRIRKDRSNG